MPIAHHGRLTRFPDQEGIKTVASTAFSTAPCLTRFPDQEGIKTFVAGFFPNANGLDEIP